MTGLQIKAFVGKLLTTSKAKTADELLAELELSDDGQRLLKLTLGEALQVLSVRDVLEIAHAGEMADG